MRAPERCIAVCVDDYGLGTAIDQAVVALARAGRVSATSCMTGAPHWREDAAQLRALEPATLDIGLHLDLTEYPFDASLRGPLRAVLARSYLRLLPRAALRVEIARQLDAFEAAMGQPPAHVDGHQHVHQLPVVREELLAQLDARYPQRRPWLRSTRRRVGEPSAKAWLIEELGGRPLERSAAGKGYRQNGHLLGVYDFQGDAARYLALLEDWLGGCMSGDVLMCHPAAGLVQGDAIAAARRVEYDVLGSAAVGELLERFGVRVLPLSRWIAVGA